MDLLSSSLVCLVLLLAAAALMVMHLRTWRKAQEGELDPVEFDFRRRQFRRRMQTSAMLALTAAVVFAGVLLTPWVGALWFGLLFVGIVVLLLVWILLLALADAVATKYHFGRLRRDVVIEQAKLQAKLRQLQPPRQNGEAEKR
jgi:hypothetical protein